MNTFMNGLKNATNYGYTENGAVKHTSTNSAVCDMFAFGAAYRSRTDADCILLFKKAFEENAELALKCLFWIRDCRGGAGERRFFRTCIKWLATEHPEAVKRNLAFIPEMGRWDDLYELVDTPLENDFFNMIKTQLEKDMEDIMTGKPNIGVSLVAKWLKSENSSSQETKRLAKRTREALGLTARTYRKTLSKLREHIKVLERLMSANRWDEIDFSKIPSKAGLIYRNAFARRDMIAEKYRAFAKSKTTKVNAGTLYPYEIVSKALGVDYSPLDDTERLMVNKYWENLPDYLDGKDCSMMCVVDTSGSMYGTPIEVAISLGMYCAERLNGPFKDHYISFASRPQLIDIKGVDFVDKVSRIFKTNLCDNTNLIAVFDLLLSIACKSDVKKEDIPKTIVVISDMEIDAASGNSWRYRPSFPVYDEWTKESAATEMEKIRQKWENYGFELPRLIYWNVNARNETILDAGPKVSFVSGMSPTLFKSILTGKNGYDLMIETICAERYSNIN